MDKSNENENENFEDCVEGKKEEDKQTDEKEKNIESDKNDEDKTIPNDNDDEDDTSNSKEKKKYIPYTMQQAQEKKKTLHFLKVMTKMIVIRKSMWKKLN